MMKVNMKVRPEFRNKLKSLASIEGKSMLDLQKELEIDFTKRIKEKARNESKENLWEKRIF